MNEVLGLSGKYQDLSIVLMDQFLAGSARTEKNICCGQ